MCSVHPSTDAWDLGLGTKARLAREKLARHARVWDLAGRVMASVDPEYAEVWTAVAITRPHCLESLLGPPLELVEQERMPFTLARQQVINLCSRARTPR